MQARHGALLAAAVLLAAALVPAFLASADSTSTASDASAPISSNADSDQALSAFHVFTESWMEKLRGASALEGVSEDRAVKRFSATYSEEVKPTGAADNPYIGILRYTEELYQCRNSAQADCTLLESTPVTEIFRYQNGVWIY